MSSIIVWPGGKHYLADWIVEHFPPHKTYVEPFGGAAHVLLAKPPSKTEVYNDYSEDLVNLFWVVKHQPQHLMAALDVLPYSRAIKARIEHEWKEGFKGATPVERAARFFYLVNAAFAGRMFGGFGFGRQRNHARAFFSKVARIKQISERLKNVMIDCVDWRLCIERYDSPDTLFYCDPPYANSVVYSHAEGSNWGLEEMRELADVLNQIEGKAVVSHYRTPEVDALFKGWRKESREVCLYLRKTKGEARDKRIEGLYMNF